MSTSAPERTQLGTRPVPGWIIAVHPGDPSAVARVDRDGEGAPEVASRDSCTVAFDGVLYNAEGLRREFPAAEADESDAALVLRLYLALGEQLAERLNGRFGLVVWDGRSGTAYAIRDRMGNHSLFYARAGADVLFSDSIDTLVAHPDVSAAVNRPLLALHVWPAWWIEEKDETYLAAIKRVIAGNVMRLDAGGSRSRRYWNPAPLGEDVDWVDDSQAIELFEATLSEAVARCLRRGPATICLSGGLDSISIASFAVEVAKREGLSVPRALSVEFPDPDSLGEADIQRVVAGRLGMPQHMMTLDEALGGTGLLRPALELSRNWPVPLLGIFSPAYFTLIEQAKSQGSDVVMTGAGGDNWLAVTLDYAADRIVRFDFVSLVRLWLMMQRSYRAPKSRLAKSIVWKYGLRNVLISLEQHSLRRVAPGRLRGQIARHAEKSLPRWLAPDDALRDELLEMSIAKRMELKPKPGDFYANEIRRSLDHPIQAVDLEEAYEKGRRLGVEVLLPYFDADLVDLLMRTHPRVLTKGNRSKSVVRESMSKRVSGVGLERQKKITTGNFWPKKLEEASMSWKELGGTRALGELGVVDPDALDAEVQQKLENRQSAAVPFIWEILDHEAWVRARL